jgi:membrane-bound inhibitor of C-type lysozyme
LSPQAKDAAVKTHLIPVAGIFVLTLFTPALAQSLSSGTTITLEGNAETRHVRYNCEEQDEELPVTYINSDPNYLALLPIEGKTMIFANVISGSGARYAAAQYVWHTKGAEAILTSEMADPDAAPLLTCLEVNNIP